MIVTETAWPFIKLQRTHHEADRFVESVNEEAEQMLPWLPPDMKTMMSIGCGVCGTEIALYKRFGHFKLYAVDGDKVDANKYGYSTDVGFYNSLQATRDMLEANEVQDFVVGVPSEPVDVVISLWSMGFHYPFDKCHLLLKKYVSSTTTLIVDIRKFETHIVIPPQFERIATITESPRHARVVLIRRT